MSNVLTNQSAQMWEQFVSSLATNAGGKGLSVSTYMPTSGLSAADWEYLDTTGIGTGTPGEIIPPNIITWADSMPEWGASYVPGNSFYDQYKAFLYSIKLKGGDPAQQQIATALGVKVTNAQQDLSDTRSAMISAWTKFNGEQSALPPSAQQSYTEWYNANYAGTISAKENALQAAEANYNAALQKVGGPDYQTLSNAIGKVTLSSGAGNALKDTAGVLYPMYKITGDLNSWFLSALQNDGKNPEVNFTIDLSQSKTYNGAKSSYFNTSVSGGYSSFFWGGEASFAYQQSKSATDYSNLVEKLSMTYTAQSMQMFTATPGNWYDSAIISAFYDQIDPNSAFANKDLFGEKGLLNLETRQILVVFRPEVTLSGTKDQISEVTNTFHQASQSSFSIGGFFWSASASVNQGQDSYNATVETSNDGKSVTFKYNSNTPKVIGIVPQNLNPQA